MRMKRFLLLAALTLAWSSFWAQDVVRHINQATPDSIPATTVPADSVAVDDEDDGPNVIGAKPTPRHKKGEANILGSPIYYDSDGRAYGTGEKSPRVVHLNNSLEGLHPVEFDNFNHFFFELKGIFRYQSAALGFSFTYLPKHVGVYGSILFGNRKTLGSLGVALRLSSSSCRTDWQLYGGTTLGHQLGFEAGIRIAETSHGERRFAWNSASAGWAIYNGHHYFTLGLSLEVAALAGILLWWY